MNNGKGKRICKSSECGKIYPTMCKKSLEKRECSHFGTDTHWTNVFIWKAHIIQTLMWMEENLAERIRVMEITDTRVKTKTSTQIIIGKRIFGSSWRKKLWEEREENMVQRIEKLTRAKMERKRKLDLKMTLKEALSL